jgi:lauroyl/myristoyl acyltransferase
MGGMLLMQIVGLAACTAPNSVVRVTSSRLPDWDYLLASRKSQTGHWNFELSFFESSEARRPKHMQRSFRNVEALKQGLLEMPGSVYPPHEIVADVERFAKAHQISLVFEFVPIE